MNTSVRKFETGATRGTDIGKLDYEAFLSPMVLERYAQYLHKHRKQSNDELRDGDNWQKGIPKNVYIKSAVRHLVTWWKEHRGHKSENGIEDAICGIIFNCMGYLFELLKEQEKQ